MSRNASRIQFWMRQCRIFVQYVCRFLRIGKSTNLLQKNFNYSKKYCFQTRLQ